MKEAGYAAKKTRTSTGFPPQAPQACASTIPPWPQGSDRAYSRCRTEQEQSRRHAWHRVTGMAASATGWWTTPLPWPRCRTARAAAIRQGTAERVRLAGRAPAFVHRRDQRRTRPTCSIRRASRPSIRRPRRAVDLSRAGSAHCLRYAGPGSSRTARSARGTCAAYVWGLEEWLIRTLDRFNVRGERRRWPYRHLGRRPT